MVRRLGGHRSPPVAGVGATLARIAASTASGLGSIPPVRPWNDDRAAAVDREPHVLDQLPGGHLDHEHDAGRGPRPRGARPTGTATARSAGTGRPARRFARARSIAGPRHPRGRAVGDDDDLGIVELLPGPADLAGGDLGVRRLELVVVALEVVGPEVERADRARLAAGGALDRPVRVLRLECREVRRHRLHRLAQDPVGEQHHRRPVALGQHERRAHQLDRLTDRRRREHRHPVVAVAVALGRLEVVGLAGRDRPEPRAAAHHVDQDAREARAGEVAHRLGHQADARARARDQHPRAGRRGAQRHVDRRELALGLDEHPALLGHPAGHPLEQLGLGRDRVAEVGVAAGRDRRLGDRLVALHQDAVGGRRLAAGPWRRGDDVGAIGPRGMEQGHGAQPSLGRANTDSAASGHIRAHLAQLVHRSGWASTTGR